MSLCRARKSGSIWGLLLEGNIRAVRSRQAHSVPALSLSQVDKALRDDPNLINARGAVGETLLHLCFLYNKPVHLTIARNILQRFPQAINAVYEGEDYAGTRYLLRDDSGPGLTLTAGENCLHIAIVNKDFGT